MEGGLGEMSVGVLRESGHWPVLHGDHLAFTMLVKLDTGLPIMRTDVILPDGRHPNLDEAIECGTCHEPFDWTAAMHRAYGA